MVLSLTNTFLRFTISKQLFTSMTDPFDKLAFVDIETNGSSVTNDRIIEIGIVRVENGQVVDKLNTLVNPEAHIPPFITGITGISSNDVVDAPTFTALQEEIYSMLDGCVFVAHNARFDYGFIRNQFRRYDYTFTSRVMCTARLSQHLFPEHTKHNLDSIIARYGFSVKKRHRAFDDAYVLWEFYQALHSSVEPIKLAEALRLITKMPATPAHLPPGLLETLPETPGVYEIYGDSPIPLYIGKSKNVRERILSHFSGDYTSDSEMDIARQTKDIRITQTAGEMGALLLESQMVREKSPVYNRKLRKAEVQAVVVADVTKEGYKTAHILEMKDIPLETIPTVIKISKSRKAARQFLENLCDENGFCKKIFGLERGNGSCFNYKIERCAGACVGEEPVEQYNAAFDEAFKYTRILPWPFAGKIGLKDHGDIHVFDQWCHLVTLTEETLYELEENSYEAKFDYEAFKLVRRFIEKYPGSIMMLS